MVLAGDGGGVSDVLLRWWGVLVVIGGIAISAFTAYITTGYKVRDHDERFRKQEEVLKTLATRADVVTTVESAIDRLKLAIAENENKRKDAMIEELKRGK